MGCCCRNASTAVHTIRSGHRRTLASLCASNAQVVAPIPPAKSQTLHRSAKTGRHRSLGVHVTFVRSVTMDVWKDRELKAMQAGPPQLRRSAAERAAARHAGGWQRSAALVPRRARSAARPQHREQIHHASGRSARPPPFPTSAPGLRSALPHLHRDVRSLQPYLFRRDSPDSAVCAPADSAYRSQAGVAAARVLRSGARATQARAPAW